MREIWQSTVEVWSWLMQHLWFINVLLSIVIVFFQRRDPKTVWTWLLAIYFIPVFGVAFYLLFGQDMKKSRMFRVKEADDRLKFPIKSQEAVIRSERREDHHPDAMTRGVQQPGALQSGDFRRGSDLGQLGGYLHRRP